MESIELKKREPHGLARWLARWLTASHDDDDFDVELLLLKESRALRAEFNHGLNVLRAELQAGLQAVLQEQSSQRAELSDHLRASREKMQARLDVLLERHDSTHAALLERHESTHAALKASLTALQASLTALQTDERVAMRNGREDVQKTLAALREEVHAQLTALRADTVAAAGERRAPPADPQLMDGCFQWLDRAGHWHTSDGVARGVVAPHYEVVRILRELVITSQIDNRPQGTAVVYSAFTVPDLAILECLKSEHCTRAYLVQQIPEQALGMEGFLQSLVNRGKVRSVGLEYRLVDPIPLEELPRVGLADA